MEEPARAKILNVDDNEAGRYSVTRLLKNAGFEVMDAATGAEALKLAKEIPDLVLLDVNLPDMNGFEVCRRLKSEPATRAIPILHLSATYKDSKSTVDGLEGGADGYLTQPVEPFVLLAHVRALIRSSRMERRLARSNRSLKALSYCNQALLRAESELDLIQEVCRILVEVAGHRFVWVGLREPDTERTVRPIATWGEDEGLLELAKSSWDETAAGCCPMGEAIRTGKPFLLRDIRTDSRCEPWRTEALKRGFVSAFALPLIIGRVVWGAISICSDTMGIFDDEERELLWELAQDLSYGIESLRTREEARRAQEGLRESERRYRDLWEKAPVMMVSLDLEARITFVSDRFCEDLGYERNEVLGRLPFEFQTGESAHYAQSVVFPTFLRTGSVKDAPLQFVKKNGEIMDVLLSVTAERDAQGAVVRSRSAFIDVTERKRAEEELQQAEQRYRGLFENAPLMYVVTRNEKGEPFISECNEFVLRSLGYEREEVQGKPLAEFYSPAARSELLEGGGYARALAGEYFMGERELVRRDGSLLPTLLYTVTEVDPSGKVTGTRAMFVDITRLKVMEEAQQESEERFRLAFENANIGVCLVDTQGRLLKVNDQACEIWGYGRSELEGMSVNDITHPEDRDISPHFIERARAGEIVRDEFEKRYIHKQGHEVWGRVSSSLVRDKQGNPLYFISHVQDRTDSKVAEKILRDSEERYRYLVESIEDLICTHDLQGNLLFVSSRPAKLLGSTPADMVGTNLRSYLAPGVRDQFDAYLAAIQRDGRASGLMLVQSSSGEKRVWEYSNTLHTEEGPEPIVVGVARDVSERMRAERVEKRLVAAIEQATEGVIITNTEGTIQYVNPGLERMTGYSRNELIGQTPRILKSGEQDTMFYRQLWNTIKAGNIWSGRFANRKKDGRLYYEDATITPVKDASGKIVNFVAVKRDVTENLELSKQLLHAQKMEAVGTLAGGIAHDFNNILQVALGYSELMLSEEGMPARYRDDLAKINQAARSGADLVQRLLMFSRKSETKPLALNLNRRIEQLQKILSRTINIPQMIKIEVILADDIASINADPTQLDQVLMNLAVNARDAMPEGGKLIIETANVVLDDDYARLHLEVVPGNYVLLTVTDTGVGMAGEVLEHIFEPFYTTKETGKGTGLGLATVHGIVEQHGGHIMCYSEPGKGTIFKLYFPAIMSDEELKQTTVETLSVGGSETILLVDDEEFIRDLGSRILTKAGYTVITASNGKEALDVYQARSDEIALVLLDLIMPEMGGKQCLDGLLSLDPAVKVIIASGYSANGPTKDALAAGAKGFVNKPYNIRQVLEVVRSVLDEK